MGSRLDQVINEKQRQGQHLIYNEYFTYSAKFEGVLAPAGSGGTERNTSVISFEADSDFVWTKTTLSIFTDSNESLDVDTQIIPNVDLFIRDTGDGKNLMQLPVNISSLAGDSRLPYILPTAYLWKAKSTAQFNIENLDPTNAFSGIQFNLHGHKLKFTGR